MSAENPESFIAYGAPAPSESSSNKVAVLVCHGMGQQVRYQTISGIAQAIRTEAAAIGTPLAPITVHVDRSESESFARAEARWIDANGAEHEVHVYEAYWAPYTEGRVTYLDTLKFLFQAAWNGLRYSKPFVSSTFDRWMFGGRQTLRIGPFTFLAMLAVLAFLLLQVAAITWVFFDILLRLRNLLFNGQPGILQPGEWFALLVPEASRLSIAGWIALVVQAGFARYFLIQYAGDVAAYVSPYKSSKFDELRHKIQAKGLSVGRFLYGLDTPAGAAPKYQSVVLVGHSLGSVLAYDTLNSLIAIDASSGNAHNVVARTRSLLTFGSPLDKTAFIFKMQPTDEEDWIREQLAASAQPLIVDYALYRPPTFRWINLWSPMDIISGELNYYDQPGVSPSDPAHVANLRDPAAFIPLFAHGQYWSGRLLRQQLFRSVS